MGCLGKAQNCIAARYVLCLMLFLGFMVTFLLRVNLNLALVAMVNNTAHHENEIPLSNCLGQAAAPNESDTVLASPMPQGEFNWSEVQQGIILGSFFWGYLVFQAPGGRVAEVYGTKRVFGGAILLNGFLSIMLPVAARTHWVLILIIRALQGLAQGVVFPALNATVSRWVPLKERSRFITFAVCGASLGTVVSMPLCGSILAAWGWEVVFYVSGLIALVWCLAWWMLVFESPDEHPRISLKEKQYLSSNLQKQKTVSPPVPWLSVATSTQFWLGCIAGWGNDWGWHTFMTLGPKYIKEALGFDLEKSSWLSALPFLCQYVFATLYGVVADGMLKKGYQVITVRRLSVTISHLLPAVGMVLLATIGCNVTMSIVILTASITCVGTFAAGFFQNPLDIAPNFAGSLTGIMNGIGSVTGTISPPLSGAILQHSGTSQGWPIIFGIAAVMYAVCSLPYILFAKATIQPWNDSNGQEVAMSAYPDGQEAEESDKLQPDGVIKL